MNDKEKRIAELEKAMEVPAGLDCEFGNWKEKCEEYGKSYASATGTMAEVIEDQWQSMEYAQIERKDYYKSANSSLEALQSCIEELPLTYPPPELLQTIVNQFKYYMNKGGEVSLEHAFLGPFKGESTYSKRMLAENRLCERFHEFVTISKRGKDLTHAKIFDEITKSGKFQAPYGITMDALEFHNLYMEEDIEQESFLRNYRRWKKRNK